jgi:NADH:ubiquinone oxidoreductase subunit 6 (subunit J)
VENARADHAPSEARQATGSLVGSYAPSRRIPADPRGGEAPAATISRAGREPGAGEAGRASFAGDLSSRAEAGSKGLRWFRTGAVVGLAGGIVGLVLPVSVNLLAFYHAIGLLTFGATLLGMSAILVMLGALLLAFSFLFYRLGFRALRQADGWFLSASILCTIGTVGLLLVLVAAALALASTPALVQCIQAAPSHATSCLRAVPPLTAYSVVAGFWLAWLGGAGIVVGLVLGGRRHREMRLVAGGSVYALLLLVLIAPFTALLLPIGGWQYPLLTLPVLAVLAPSLVLVGSHRALGL